MNKEETDCALQRLDRLELQIKMARSIIQAGNIVMPCKEIHPGLHFGHPIIRIGDFIIEDTLEPIPVKFDCSAREFCDGLQILYPECPESKALFK